MTRSNIPRPHPELLQALATKTALCVVGSGLSLDAGAPSWTALLEGIAAEAFELDSASISAVAEALQLLEQKRFLESAAILEELLGDDFKMSVVRQFKTSRKIKIDKTAVITALSGKKVATLFSELGEPVRREMRPNNNHRMLTQLPFRGLVTTNYDMLLEEAAPRDGALVASYSRTDPHLSRIARSGKWFVFKIHGDIENPHDIVLSPSNFTSAIFHERSGEVLRSLFQLNMVFWIGCGHQDPTLSLLIDELREKLGLSGGFALVRRDIDRQIKKRLKDASIMPIYLESYHDISTYLRRLAEDLGSPVVFPVKTALASDTLLGPRIARFFTKAVGQVNYWMHQGKIIYLEARPKTLESLRSRFHAGSPDANYAFERYGLVSFDDHKIFRMPSSHTLITRRQDDLAVVALVGKITIGVGDLALRKTIQELLDEGARKIVLDGRLVATLDSSGFGELFSVFTAVANRGGRLVLTRPTEKVIDILQITGMIKVIDTFDSVEEAIDFLGGTINIEEILDDK